MCEECPQPTAATVAWYDQFQAEVRDVARLGYSQALAAAGVKMIVTEQQLAEQLDPLFQVGADAMLVVLGRHGCLKKAER